MKKYFGIVLKFLKTILKGLQFGILVLYKTLLNFIDDLAIIYGFLIIYNRTNKISETAGDYFAGACILAFGILLSLRKK
jgi:hypothetical protein